MRLVLAASLVLAGCVDGGEVELGREAAPLTVCGGSLQAAIDAAADGATLDICAGTYAERLQIAGKRLTLRGAGAGSTIIDAQGLGPALDVRDSDGGGVILRNLTLRNGRTAGSGATIACRASKLYVRDTVVSGGRADQGGGGLGADGCILDVARSRFEGNDAGDGRGGGLLAVASSGVVRGNTFTGNDAYEGGGLATVGGTVELIDNDIVDNLGHRGAGLYLGNDAPVTGNRIAGNDAGWTAGGVYIDGRTGTFSGNVVDGNTSVNDGGGLYVHEGAPRIVDNVFTGNHSGDDGGGVRIYTSETLLEGNLIEGNLADDSGGGIRVSHLPAQIVDNVVRGNQAELGGGMDLDNCSSVVRGGEVTGNRAVDGGGISSALYPWLGAVIEDVRFEDNVASNRGGALFVVDNYKPVTLRRLTVRNNRAATGGGLYVSGTDHTLVSSLFAGNTATGDGGALRLVSPGPTATPRWEFLTLYRNSAGRGAALRASSPLSLASSIVSEHGGAAVSVSVAPTWRYNDTWPASFDGMADPTGIDGNLSVDPAFVDAASADVALAAGSPARDAGDPAVRDLDGTRADMGRFGGPDAGAAPPPPPPPPAGVVLEADATVAERYPTTNQGSEPTLAADSSPQLAAYLRFRVTGAGTVTGARLRLTVTNSTADAPRVHAAASTWDEATITWNHRPAPGAEVADLGAIGSGVVEYDVSSLVTGDGVYTLVLVPESTDGFAAYSREGAAAPELMLTTSGGGGGGGAVQAVLDADTFADSSAPTTSSGGAATLYCDGSPAREAFLRFQVSGLSGPATRATLRLTVVDGSSDGPAVHLASSAWDEATVTWNQRPALAGGALADLGATALGTVDVDVTAAVTGDGTYTFALVPTSSSGLGVAARESATPPVLIVE